MQHRLLLSEPGRLGEPVCAPRPPEGGGPATPWEFHRLLPGYARTELRDLPAVAELLGVGSAMAKVETLRMGLPAYKILGASWATYRAVLADRSEPIGRWSDLGELRDQLSDRRGTRLVAATDGNHGRAVARMARLLGWDARILVPRGTAPARIDGIAGEGATVEVVDGSYDDAVDRSATYADERTLVISDTAWEGYRDVPGWVVDGYATVFAEIDDQVSEAHLRPPTHVVVPVGVGSLAAAAAGHYGPRSTTLIAVEPTSAACVMASVAAGTSVEVPGPHDSCMAGLNCGLPSPLALPVVQDAFRGFVAIDDEWAEQAIRTLAALDLAVGESAAAALGGLLALRPEESAALALDRSSSVLLVLTEGVTDPVNYERILAGSGTARR